MGQVGVIYYAQTHTDRWPNENATDRAYLDNCDSSFAHDANGRKGEDGATTKAKTNKGGRSPSREGENNAAQFLAETAGRPEGLAPGVDFPIHILKK